MKFKERFKENYKKRQIHRQNYFAISGPVLGAINLLKAHQDNPGLNLGTVRRAREWGWSTYSYLYDDLGRWRKDIQGLLEGLEKAIAEYDWDSVDYATDGWDEALWFVNNHECGEEPKPGTGPGGMSRWIVEESGGT